MSPSAVRQAGSVLGILLAGAPTGALIGMLQRVLASSGSTWGAALSSFAALGVAATGSYWTRDINHVAILWDVASWANVAILLQQDGYVRPRCDIPKDRYVVDISCPV